MPGAQGVFGPELTAIGRTGTATEDFMRQSIVDPNAVIAPDCPFVPCQAGLMPQFYGLSLTEDDLDALVVYLLSLK